MVGQIECKYCLVVRGKFWNVVVKGEELLVLKVREFDVVPGIVRLKKAKVKSLIVKK